jgi:thiol-disulfide isomerase/thioredoxin
MIAATATAAEPPKIGDTIGKFTFTDIRSLPRSLGDFGEKKAYVLVFFNNSCPLALRYLPVLQAMEKEYRAKGVQFIALNAAEEDSLIDMATLGVKHDLEFPLAKDFDGDCAKALGVKRTPEVAVLDAAKKLVYRGRIDDQYRLGGVRKEATTHDLKDAIEAVLAGKKVENAETNVDGCPITFPQPREAKKLNFAEHVAPILQKHCWSCHYAGGSAPFSLTNHHQASSRSDAIIEAITDQRMPPWFASHEFGPFTNRRGLSEAERNTIVDWARGGAAAGDPAKTPPPPKPSESKWVIGEPDLVLKTVEIELPAKGDIPYQYAVLPHLFTEDTWVKEVQILPENPRVLHHCNMAYGSFFEKFDERNFITGQVPGGEAVTLDPGVAVLIPKGSMLGLQMHFVATGKPEKCRVLVGLRYPREIVQRRLQNIQLATTRFAIPPGDPAHKVAATRTLDRDVVGVGLFSHMHLRGKDMSFIAHYPTNKDETLLVIPNYNFSWQIPYRWESGKKLLPKGTKLECVAHYDNSAFNPYNPDPKATVRNGPQTHHEMMVGFFFYTDANEKLDLHVDAKTGHLLTSRDR